MNFGYSARACMIPAVWLIFAASTVADAAETSGPLRMFDDNSILCWSIREPSIRI
jgi:hypothetical protein